MSPLLRFSAYVKETLAMYALFPVLNFYVYVVFLLILSSTVDLFMVKYAGYTN